jgi:hypothetical protein
MSTKSKLLIILGVLALFGAIVLYMFEIQWYQNYLQPGNMVIGSLVLGMLIGISLGYRLQNTAAEMVDKMRIWVVCFVVSILPMPLLASLTNRLFSSNVQEMEVVFWSEKADLSQPFGYIKGESGANFGHYIFVVVDGKIIRLKSKAPRFPFAVEGDIVKIPVRKGLWGADYVAWQEFQ